MRNIKRFFSILVVVALASIMAVSAFAAAPEAGTKYEFDINVTTAPVSEHFYIFGISEEDGSIHPVEDTARKTWSDSYPGFYVVGATSSDDYIGYKSERNDEANPDGLVLDHMCHGAYKSAFAFKAPADGKYDVYYKAQRYSGTAGAKVNLTMVKGGTDEVLAKAENLDKEDYAEFDVKNVELKAGEEIWVICSSVDNSSAGQNTRVLNFDVTFVGAAGGDVTPPNGGNTNPKTSDNLALTVGVLALAATGVVIASKKRR